ncbi:MAG: DUF4223 family protein [Cellvibrionales bacterium]|nr:DUF4223 family protein [Cellvibrionales bacterium]
MKNLPKLAALGVILAGLTACTGTAYNKDRTCGTDYLLHPAISVSKIVGGCKDYKAEK